MDGNELGEKECCNDSADTDSSDDEPIEYYRDDPAYPVFSSSQKVLSPEDTVKILSDKCTFPLSRICHRQPLLVEHHRTFIVDISSLKSPKDLKCDDMGSWRNNSSHKYSFDVEWDENGNIEKITSTKNSSENRCLTLKREYFQLNHDIHEDVRKRIDTILGKLSRSTNCRLKFKK